MTITITPVISVQEIDEIVFGIFSPEEIKKMAVCEVNSPKLCNNDKNSSHGTVYDSRMGTIENGIPCVTCKLDLWQCPGHWGYIILNEGVVHPLFFKQVVNFLRCFCSKCYKLLITKDQILLNNFNRFKGINRFVKILDKLEKLDMCIHCSHPQPTIKYTASDNSIAMVYKDKDKGKVSIILQVDEIKKIFDNINNSDVVLLGFNPELMHPRNLIITIFPVLPISSRPYVITDGNICDDDLTIQLVEIIKANNHLFSPDGVPLDENKKLKALQSLKFRISTFYNNSSGKAKHSTNGRAIKGIKERLAGKNGVIRTNLMGKRCDMTARTVIGPDPTLKMGQICIPPQIASNLTIPVRVTNFNYSFLTELMYQGKINSVIEQSGAVKHMKHTTYFKGTILNHGDIVVRMNPETGEEFEFVVTNGKDIIQIGDKVKRNGEFLKDVVYPEIKIYQLQIGQIVDRQLLDGDIVLLNRQPTLHAQSMLAQEIVIREGKTIRFNLAINKGFNADFD